MIGAYFDFIGKLLNDVILLSEIKLYRLQVCFEDRILLDGVIALLLQ